jgi:putative flippase GtrA
LTLDNSSSRFQAIWENRVFRFLVVGFFNTLFGYGLYVLLVLVDVEYHLALTVATAIGILFNFKTTGTIVFRDRRLGNVFRFVLIYFVIYLVNQLLLTLLVNVVEDKIMSQAMCLPLIVVLTYFSNKLFVFNSRSPQA